MEYGFWSDGTPCGAQSVYINKYFEGRKFRHRLYGHAVIHGSGEYIEGRGNVFAITAERCAVRFFIAHDVFFSDEMLKQIDPLNRLRFTRFAVRFFAESQKRYQEDRDAYMRTLKLEREGTIHSSSE